jgi:hypothetical protein
MATAVVDKPRDVNELKGRARSLANLKPPIRPGETRNPAGRPRVPTFTEIMRKELNKPIKGAEDITRMKALGLKLYDQAMKGNTRAAKLILERLDPAKQRIDRTDLKVLAIHLIRQSEPGLDAQRIIDAATEKPLLEATNADECNKDR